MLHEFETITRQDVDVLIPHPTEGVALISLIPKGEAVEMAGCKNCSMGLEEAMGLPCPGIAIEDMLRS